MSCYFLIPEDDVVYDQIKYAMRSLELNSSPSREQVIKYYNECTYVWVDTTDSNKRHRLIEMGFSFSTPYKGYPGMSLEVKDALDSDAKWEHNK